MSDILVSTVPEMEPHIRTAQELARGIACCLTTNGTLNGTKLGGEERLAVHAMGSPLCPLDFEKFTTETGETGSVRVVLQPMPREYAGLRFAVSMGSHPEIDVSGSFTLDDGGNRWQVPVVPFSLAVMPPSGQITAQDATNFPVPPDVTVEVLTGEDNMPGYEDCLVVRKTENYNPERPEADRWQETRWWPIGIALPEGIPFSKPGDVLYLTTLPDDFAVFTHKWE